MFTDNPLTLTFRFLLSTIAGLAFLITPVHSEEQDIPDSIFEVEGKIHAYSIVSGTPVVESFYARSSTASSFEASFDQQNRSAYITGTLSKKSVSFNAYASGKEFNLIGPAYWGAYINGIVRLWKRAGIPYETVTVSATALQQLNTTGSAGGELSTFSPANGEQWSNSREAIPPFSNNQQPKSINTQYSKSNIANESDGPCKAFPEFPSQIYCRTYQATIYTSTLLLQNASTPAGDIEGSTELSTTITLGVIDDGDSDDGGGSDNGGNSGGDDGGDDGSNTDNNEEKREREPGNEEGPRDCLTNSLDPISGNGHHVYNDPVRTRGYPLINNIHFDTQSVESNRALGSATFTYDIHLSTENFVDGEHLMLVDGDGDRFNYGLISINPQPEPGVFGILKGTESGYLLEEAGAPEHINDAGNFTYYFDADGRLLELHDPAGNIQRLTYASTGMIERVDDLNSQKWIQFLSDGKRVTEIVENRGGATTKLTYNNGLLTDISADTNDSTVIPSAKITYNENSLISSYTFDNNSASKVVYDYVFRDSLTPGKPQVPLANITVSSSGSTNAVYEENITLLTNCKGGVTTYEFNDSGDVTTITSPEAGNTWTKTYEYDDDRNIISIDDGTVVTTTAYNDRGLPIKITRGDDVTTIKYQGVDVLSVRDSRGVLFSYYYANRSLPHHPTARLDGAGAAWRYQGTWTN